jgi:hypothetical protein
MKEETETQEKPRKFQVNVWLSDEDAQRFIDYMKRNKIRRKAVAAYQAIMIHLDADESERLSA